MAQFGFSLNFERKKKKIVLEESSVAEPDPHLKSPPGSGSTWTDADPDPGGKKP